jgi:hypothetical protein
MKGESMKGKYRQMFARAAVISLVFIIILSAYPIMPSRGAGATVFSTPPTFFTVKVQDVESRIVVTVEVSDYNGWEDVYKVQINITDSFGNIVERAEYSQYSSNVSNASRIDEFKDLKGGALIPKESDVERFPYKVLPNGNLAPDWFNSTYQRMTFVFKPFSGFRILVTAYDRKMLSCVYTGPFNSEYEVPPVIENPTIPITISLIVAGVSGIILYIHRKENNRLARLAEEKIGG